MAITPAVLRTTAAENIILTMVSHMCAVIFEVRHNVLNRLKWTDWEKSVLRWPVFCKESQGFNWIARWLRQTQVTWCHSKEDGKSYNDSLLCLSCIVVQLVWLGSKPHGLHSLPPKRQSGFQIPHREQRSRKTMQVSHLLDTDRVLQCQHCLAAVSPFQISGAFFG